jgi:HAMP domain-containing protein
VTIDAATIAQTIAQLGATGLLAVGLWVVWRRLREREDRLDRVADEALARQERVIGMLSGDAPAPPGERRDHGRA